jgi:hypothetical protein
MATYGELAPDNYYLLQEQEGAMLQLVYITMHTSKCVLVEYQDQDQTLTWYRKTDSFLELVDELTEAEALEYESIFEEEEENFWNSMYEGKDHWEEDDDEDDDFEDLEDDDFDDIASRN